MERLMKSQVSGAAIRSSMWERCRGMILFDPMSADCVVETPKITFKAGTLAD